MNEQIQNHKETHSMFGSLFVLYTVHAWVLLSNYLKPS